MYIRSLFLHLTSGYTIELYLSTKRQIVTHRTRPGREIDGASFAYPVGPDDGGDGDADGDDAGGESDPRLRAGVHPEGRLVHRRPRGDARPRGTHRVGQVDAGELLVRTYDPDAGAIRLDGRDVRGVTLESLRDAAGYASQGSFLFPGTVHENIAYGRFDATDVEVEAAARGAGPRVRAATPRRLRHRRGRTRRETLGESAPARGPSLASC